MPFTQMKQPGQQKMQQQNMAGTQASPQPDITYPFYLRPRMAISNSKHSTHLKVWTKQGSWRRLPLWMYVDKTSKFVAESIFLAMAMHDTWLTTSIAKFQVA